MSGPMYCPQCLAKLPPPSPVERPVCNCCLQPTATVHLSEGLSLCLDCCSVHYEQKFGTKVFDGTKTLIWTKMNGTETNDGRPPRQTTFDFKKYNCWILGGWSK